MEANAIFLPSGDQADVNLGVMLFASLIRFVPSEFIINISGPPSFSEVNTIFPVPPPIGVVVNIIVGKGVDVGLGIWVGRIVVWVGNGLEVGMMSEVSVNGTF